MLALRDRRISSEGVLVLKAQRFRSQEKNRADALARLQELIAGITVAVVLIPQAMAYAMLAGMPPVFGLYAAAVTPGIAAHQNFLFHIRHRFSQ